MFTLLQKLRSQFGRSANVSARPATRQGPSTHWSNVDLADARKVPGMTAEDELKYFQWCTEKFHQPGRRVVELGPYVGRSTAAMVNGLRNSSDPNGKLVTIDWFHWEEWMLGYMLQHTLDGMSAEQRGRLTEGQRHPKPGDSYRPFFDVLMAPYLSSLEVIDTDLQKFKWSGEPIDVFMIDAAKTWELLDQILLQFFPSLIDGASVVHQDYKHMFTYWLHPVTERMIERGVLVMDDIVGGVSTQGFRFNRRGDFRVADYLQSAFTVPEMDKLLGRSVERFRAAKDHIAVVAARCRMLRTNGQEERAKKIAEEEICAGGYVDNYFLVDMLTAATGWARSAAAELIAVAKIQANDSASESRLDSAGDHSVSTPIPATGDEVVVDFPGLNTKSAGSLAMQFQSEAKDSVQSVRISAFEPGAARPFYEEKLKLEPGSLKPIVIPLGQRSTISMQWAASTDNPSATGQTLKCIAPIALMAA